MQHILHLQHRLLQCRPILFENEEKKIKKEYNEKNKEKIIKKRRIYEQNNKSSIKLRKSEYYKNNKERIISRQLNYQQLNKEEPILGTKRK